MNALPPFRRGCISVPAARYKFWRRFERPGVGRSRKKKREAREWRRQMKGRGKESRERQREKKKEKRGRRRKIGPMVIDYLPRIPRIPYSDRPHGPKIEPSITGAPHSLSLSSLPSSTSVHGSPSPRHYRLFFFQGARTRNFERPGKRVALIKRAQIWHLLGTSNNSGIFLLLLRIYAPRCHSII